jgi:nucleoid-associated protein EbfC
MNPNMIKQAQQLQARLVKAQEELGNMVTEVTVGGGAIKITIDGKQLVRAISISPDLASSGDVEMLQDMMVAGMNEAVTKSQEMATQHLGKITGGLNIPGLF